MNNDIYSTLLESIIKTSFKKIGVESNLHPIHKKDSIFKLIEKMKEYLDEIFFIFDGLSRNSPAIADMFNRVSFERKFYELQSAAETSEELLDDYKEDELRTGKDRQAVRDYISIMCDKHGGYYD